MSASNRNVESEYIEINSNDAWPNLYQDIRNASMKFDFKCLEARKPQNKTLNRYRDVNPYDQSRVVLSRGPCDYINANLVPVDRANRKYILTQGPLPETVGHFWLMVWEQKTKAVLMLNKLVEKRQVKCHCYWPEEVGPDYIMYLEDVALKLEYLEYQDHSYYSTRRFRLTDTESNTSREIQQFHYTTWPDFGVPTSPTAFLEFLRNVRESGALESNVGPVVVHCSAGIGRSGTFCLVDSCLIMIEKYGLNAVDVKDVLLEMRRFRMGLIQTPDQLRFSYQAIIEGAKRQSNNHSDTENYTEVIFEETLSDEEEDNEPPPLPPPRGESLTRSHVPPFDRPLPTIPKSTSMNDFLYNEANSDIVNSNAISEEIMAENCVNCPPERPLPGVPLEDHSESSSDYELELEPEPEVIGDTTSNPDSSLSPSLIRQRKRQERTEKLSARVQEMKRKQQSAEQWANAKRSLYRPITIGLCVVFLLGGGALAYAYYKG